MFLSLLRKLSLAEATRAITSRIDLRVRLIMLWKSLVSPFVGVHLEEL